MIISPFLSAAVAISVFTVGLVGRSTSAEPESPKSPTSRSVEIQPGPRKDGRDGESQPGPERADPRGGPGPETQESPSNPGNHRRHLEHLRERLKHAEENGNKVEADELRHQIARQEPSSESLRGSHSGPGFQRQGAQNREGLQHRPRPDGAGRNEPGQRGVENRNRRMGTNQGSLQERMEHLEQSVAHLRAAGFPELAEQAEIASRQLREEFSRRHRPGQGLNQDRGGMERQPAMDPNVMENIRDIRRQLDDTRRGLEELRSALQQSRR